MPLPTGAKLGHYEIAELIGKGGMGEVYKALDTKLNRQVALKVLPGALANNAERMARFQREAQLLASLNHPNIAAIYGLEDSGDHRAIVMELVEGETLQGPLPIPEMLRLAKQIAEAVEYAHDKGVIHRDLKPANIKLTHDGQVKVLDFGLAKALDDAGHSAPEGDPMNSLSPTLTIGATQAGVILGTAAYMAPEQAKGKRADRKADIWSFGVVLHEMLTGKRVFSGETMAETLASVMKEQLSFDDLPKDTPPALRKLVTRCLERDLKRRMQSMGEARIVIDDVIAGVSTEEPAATPAMKPAGKLPWAVAAVFGAALLALAGWTFYPRAEAPSAGAIRFTIAPPEGTILTPVTSGGPQVSVSPDGRYMAFVIGNDQTIWVRALGSLSAQKLDKTEGARFPFWSPDSQHIAFFSEGQLKRIPVSGGSPVKVAEAENTADGGAWFQEATGEGVIVFASSAQSALQRVPAAGGKPTPFSKLLEGETGHTFPQFLPDGKRVLYFVRGGAKPGIYAQALGAEERTFVAATPGRAVFAPPNFLLFLSGNTLMAQRLNPSTLQLQGEPVSVADDVRSGGVNSRNNFSVSSNGVLAYRAGGGGSQSQLTWYTRDGKPAGTALRATPMGEFTLSPDDKLVALRRDDNDQDLWLLELATGVLSRLVPSKGQESEPEWAPDSRRVAFRLDAGKGRLEIHHTAIGSGSASTLLAANDAARLLTWTRQKQLLILQGDTVAVIPEPEEGTSAGKSAPAKPEAVFTATASVDLFTVSPDGKWVAYMSQETGTPQIMVAAFPSFMDRRQISSVSGTQPLWRADGKELFFLSQGAIKSVDVKSGAKLETGPVRELFSGVTISSATSRTYGVTRDGQRFLVMEPPGASPNAVEPVYVIANWPALVK